VDSLVPRDIPNRPQGNVSELANPLRHSVAHREGLFTVIIQQSVFSDRSERADLLVLGLDLNSIVVLSVRYFDLNEDDLHWLVVPKPEAGTISLSRVMGKSRTRFPVAL
jgi:hypothetical protein